MKMTKLNILYLFVFIVLLSSCKENEGLLVEENPHTSIVNSDDYDFVIEGDIDGEEFKIVHQSNLEYNAPANDGGGVPSFGTSFSLQLPGQAEPYEHHILFGLTESGSSSLKDIIQVGSYGWYNHAVPTQSVREAVIHQLKFGDDQMTSTIHPSYNPDNYFEITSVTLIEDNETLDEAYAGRLYKVEGHFAIDLYKWDNSGDVPRLTVSHFSAIFYDDSM